MTERDFRKVIRYDHYPEGCGEINSERDDKGFWVMYDDYSDACEEIDSLREENKKLEEQYEVELKHRVREMKVRQKYEKFVDHIQNHLNDGEEVICKICGKTAKEIMESD